MKLVTLSFLFLVGGYIALIELWEPPIVVWENQEVINAVRAERFLYQDIEPEGVIIGSSLVAQMRYFLDQEELFVLSQQGGSAREGLELLVKAGKYPEFIFVELNALPVTHRQNFAKRLSDGWRPFLAAHLKAFQVEYRPINLLINIARNTLAGGGPSPGAPLGDPWGPLPSVEHDPYSEASRVRLAALKASYVKGAGTESYLNNLQAVSKLLGHLAEKKVQIVLLELPVHPELLTTKYHQTRRELAQRAFEDKYKMLDLSSMPGAVFPDGIHLPLNGTREIVRRLKNYNF